MSGLWGKKLINPHTVKPLFHCSRIRGKGILQHICNKHKRAKVVSDEFIKLIVIISINGDYLSQNAWKQAIKQKAYEYLIW